MRYSHALWRCGDTSPESSLLEGRCRECLDVRALAWFLRQHPASTDGRDWVQDCVVIATLRSLQRLSSCAHSRLPAALTPSRPVHLPPFPLRHLRRLLQPRPEGSSRSFETMVASGPTTLDFDLRTVQQPIIYTEKVGGPRESWTCVVPGVSGRVFIPERPCATFPLNMRRSGPATFTATLTWDAVGGMSFQNICPATGLVATTVTSDSTGDRRLTLGGFALCDTLRVVKTENPSVPVHIRVSIVRAD